MLLRISAKVGPPHLPTAVKNRARSPVRRATKVKWVRFPADNKEDETRQRIIKKSGADTSFAQSVEILRARDGPPEPGQEYSCLTIGGWMLKIDDRTTQTLSLI